jgi:putative sterol carrier protein
MQEEPTMSAQEPGSEPQDMGADQLAAMVAQVSDEQLAQGMASEARPQILGEIFNRMAEHFDPTHAAGIEAVIHWKILDRPEGGFDHYEVVIRDGACTLSETAAQAPRVTLSVKPVEFLRLVTGTANGPELFMTGRLLIEGDMMFAAQVAGMFKIPQAAA